VELNKIYNEDCLEGMKRIPNNTIDLVVTDPPYLMNYRSNRRVKSEKFDYIQNDKNSNDLISDYINECNRIMKDNTAIYVFCSWHNIDFFKVEFEKHFTLKNILIWNKNNHGTGDLKGSYAPKYEMILFGHKGRTLLREKRVPDVIDCNKISSSKLNHPTEKPIELLELFINNSSDRNSLVFDGFAGSGTTAIACVNTNRNFIGFELDENYHKIACERVAEWYNSKTTI
jgi:site-specific DNA-methyltransferase (adenine-specific)